MSNGIFVVDYDSRYPSLFHDLGSRLRTALGSMALRIDHIGSTAVPHLLAKPVIDIQISVAALEPVAEYQTAIETLGFFWRQDNPDRMKRYFREVPGTRRTHIHVRRAGSWSEQFALLFRDYLRATPDDARRYGQLKSTLAQRYADDRHAYTDAKEPFIWETMLRADQWAKQVGWEPEPSDC